MIEYIEEWEQDIDIQPQEGIKKTAPLGGISKNNIFNIRTANECIKEAKLKPKPKPLLNEFWSEGEISILFAGAGIGKTVLAVQIGSDIASGNNSRQGFNNQSQQQVVLYFDFELSDKQFEKRYSNNYENHFLFDDNFIRIEIHPDAEDFSEKQLYDSFEEAIKNYNAKVVIVDNITYLKSNLETSKDALPLMKKLKSLKRKYNLSLLVLAHTPKRDNSREVTINDLAGSSQLSNFADSIFTINKSSIDIYKRYIKQIKARNTDLIFDSENVFVCEILNSNNFLSIDFIGYGFEQDHLKQNSDESTKAINLAILELKKAHPEYSLQKIADQLNTNKMKVSRVLKQNEY